MMVRQMKEDAKGKSEEELAECFRVFDRCIGGLRAEAGAEQSEIGPQGTKVLGVGVPGVECGGGSEPLPALSPALSLRPKERRRLHRCGGAG